VIKTYAPADYDQRTPTPVREGGEFPGDDQQSVRCYNCRQVNHLSEDLPDTATWLCWHCHQAQTLSEANKHSAPVGIEELSSAPAALGILGFDPDDLTRKHREMAHQMLGEGIGDKR
jgi:hypothetical protein